MRVRSSLSSRASAPLVFAIGLFLFCATLWIAIWNVSPLALLDALWIAAILSPGIAVVSLLEAKYPLGLGMLERAGIGSSIGLGVAVLLVELCAWLHTSHLWMYVGLAILLGGSVLALRRTYHGLDWIVPKSDVAVILGVTAVLTTYVVANCHPSGNGGLVATGLYGIDLPFLAGEIHGIRLFGELRDLHQNAIAWQYHEAIYRVLSVLPDRRTISSLSFTAPLLGIGLLALNVVAVLRRLTSRTWLVVCGTMAWFGTSGLWSTELSSYALSPSFTFGTCLLLSAMLLLLVGTQVQLSGVRCLLLTAILATLGTTKLSTYAVAALALGLISLATLAKRRTFGWELMIALAVSGVITIVLARPSRLMPADDFLVGAPLFGYAAHAATLLGTSLDAVNPVSFGFELRAQSFLILPFFLFHLVRLVVTDPRLLSLIVTLLLIRKSRVHEGVDRGRLRSFLWLVIPIGIFLPVLYSPAWYPLAFSFYAPMVGLQAAVLLLVSYWEQLRTRRVGWVILVFVGISGFTIASFHGVRELRQPDHGVDSTVAATLALIQPTGTDRILSHRFDLDLSDTLDDESYYWYAALAGTPVVSEGAKYGALLSATADVDSAKGLHPVRMAQSVLRSRRSLLDSVFLSHDSARVAQSIADLGGTYLLEDLTAGARLHIDGSKIGRKLAESTELILWKLDAAPLIRP